MVGECTESGARVEHLNNGLVRVCKQVSGQADLNAELRDGQDASS